MRIGWGEMGRVALKLQRQVTGQGLMDFFRTTLVCFCRQEEHQTWAPVMIGRGFIIKTYDFRAASNQGGSMGQSRKMSVKNGDNCLMIKLFTEGQAGNKHFAARFTKRGKRAENTFTN